MKHSSSLDPLALALVAGWQPVGSLYLWLLWGVRMIGGKQALTEPSLGVMLGVVTAAVFLIRLDSGSTPVGLRRPSSWVIAGIVVVASGVASGASSPLFLAAMFRLHDWRAAANLFMILAGSLLLLGWGFRVGRAQIAQEGVAQSLSRSSWTILVLFLLTVSFPVVQSREMLIPVLLIFLSGTAGLALANFARVRPGSAKGVLSHGLDRYWIQTVSAVAALLLLTGLVLTGWMGTQSLAQISTFFLILLAALFTGLSWVIVAFGVVVFLLIYPLYQYLQRLFGPLVLPTPAPTAPAPGTSEAAGQVAANPIVVTFFEVGGYLLAISILAALVLVVFLLRRRSETSRPAVEEETRESLFSAELLRQQVIRLLGRLHLWRAAILPPFVELPADEDARTRIRRAYQGLLSWAAERGRPRQAGETPLRYRQILAKEFPHQRRGITDLTDLYAPARYGPEDPPPEAARRAEDLSRLLWSGTEPPPPRKPPGQDE
ncbi:MAG: DUF4129 domain-containing protein [Anaerolineales bacterium]